MKCHQCSEQEQQQAVTLRDGQERSMHAETIAMQVFIMKIRPAYVYRNVTGTCEKSICNLNKTTTPAEAQDGAATGLRRWSRCCMALRVPNANFNDLAFRWLPHATLQWHATT